MSTVRLILGDQLNPLHPWFEEPSADVVYVMMEVRQETDYVLHHAQKILAIFAAMRAFADQLRAMGHRVHYLKIDDPFNDQSIPGNLDECLQRFHAGRFEYQAPDEWRLEHQLAEYCAAHSVAWAKVDSHHFYTSAAEASDFFGARRRWLMESFYRHMRRKHHVLIEPDGKPAGGQWNFDHDNRHAWSGMPAEPTDERPLHHHEALWRDITAAGVKSFGEPCADAFRWPLHRAEALEQLENFVRSALPHFGPYQDAMSHRATRLFHSLLSFALNTKMLNPREVVDRVETAWREGCVPLASAEGFIRQILGWREYVRGVYWAKMPIYAQSNAFGHERSLPSWFWNGRTQMRCVSHSITQSLNHAHAHHIQRLMVIGNFALLAGLAPEEVHRWYLGIYIDAFEWVELPNTLGMSQYADGGLLATKPYVSSAAYIHHISDYCQGCYYSPKDRTGARGCPYNALYWDFFMRNEPLLHGTPRLAMVYRQLGRMSKTQRVALQTRARLLLENIEKI